MTGRLKKRLPRGLLHVEEGELQDPNSGLQELWKILH